MFCLTRLRLKTWRERASAPLRHASALALYAAVLAEASMLVAAQQPAVPKPRSAPASSAVKASRAAKQSRQQAATPIPPVAPPAPAAPPAPVWPINQQPQQARVVWDSQGLEIDASNSSLDQILREVSTDTGVKIEGFGKDQRIFGTYGPGPAREVISRLLDGSGYNVLMIGGLGDAPPSRIALSASTPAGQRSASGAQRASVDEDAEADEPPQPEEPEPQPQPPAQEPQQPAPLHNPFGNNPRVPMQVNQPPFQTPQQNNQQQ